MAKNRQARPDKTWQWAMLGLGAALTVCGIVLGGMGALGRLTHQPGTRVAAQAIRPAAPPKTSAPLISGQPAHVTVASVGIDLAVIPGYYYPNSGAWTLSLGSAQWGAITAQANNSAGLTYIYAHNRLHVFHDLPQVQPGDKAIVSTANGHTFTYKFRSSTATSPTNTSILGYKGAPILVLQTCTGAWYQYRQLYVFDLTSAQ